MSKFSYKITRWKSTDEEFQVNKLEDYADAVTETCNYMRSSIDNTSSSYIIRVVTHTTEFIDISIDELEPILLALSQECGLIALVECMRDSEMFPEKIIRIDKPIPNSYSVWERRWSDGLWNNGGLQECGSCFDTCRCCNSDDSDDYDD